jgi:hypothetical protein
MKHRHCHFPHRKDENILENSIYWMDFYYMSLQHLLFLIGSLAELLIPICSLFQIQYVSKLLKDYSRATEKQ